MGIVASCKRDVQGEFFIAIGEGDLQHVKFLLDLKPKLINQSLPRTALSPLHHAASCGQPDVLSLLLEKGAVVDVLNHHKQTPLMLACKNGRLACIDRLVEWRANVLIFDTSHGRTCLHYVAKSGHLHCLQKVLYAAQLPAVAQTWGYTQFINVRDGSGATPLHLAARSCHPSIVRLLLSSGALVCAITTKSSSSSNSLGFGSTPLHFAARGGSIECVKELLAWGADRLQRNSQGHTPFLIAMKYHNTACATLLNPLTAEPLVWPSPWKFMRNLDPEAKVLLETALAQANDAWEKQIFSASGSYGVNTADLMENNVDVEDDQEEIELCCICFEQTCTIEVRDCGHQMCAGCTLALCCHNKPNPAVPSSPAPVCPFCRSKIEQLRKAQPKETEQVEGVKDIPRQIESLREDDRDSHRILGMSQHKKPIDGGGTSSFMGIVSKGSFRTSLGCAWLSEAIASMMGHFRSSYASLARKGYKFFGLFSLKALRVS
ncbi:hypothetical protein GOP47_0021809 [Adiantum capillus-veneris]|uniref:RING-type E3 ubiquitin transferase n=1 Tax=Adiantum capillus-veneris TaxID=13818 RepID=A0A9D4Z7A2_ADICA|nr:hypothetical protein GOP47_0021809 [Adiantum capillus-veneris]